MDQSKEYFAKTQNFISEPKESIPRLNTYQSIGTSLNSNKNEEAKNRKKFFKLKKNINGSFNNINNITNANSNSKANTNDIADKANNLNCNIKTSIKRQKSPKLNSNSVKIRKLLQITQQSKKRAKSLSKCNCNYKTINSNINTNKYKAYNIANIITCNSNSYTQANTNTNTNTNKRSKNPSFAESSELNNISNYADNTNSNNPYSKKAQIIKFAKNSNLFKVKRLKYKSIWSTEEDRLLLHLVSIHGNKKWKSISKFFTDKNPIQCSARYKRIKPGNLKGKWTKEEDNLLLKLIKVYKNNWSAISKIIKTRTAKQVRDRYVNCLDPSLKKGNFTKEEDDKIIYYYNMYGPNWLKISEIVKFRTPDTIKNRYYLYLKKKNTAGKFKLIISNIKFLFKLKVRYI